LHFRLESLAVHLASTLVEQEGDKAGRAGLAVRLECEAAFEGKIHRDHRHGPVLNQPDFYARRAFEGLNVENFFLRHGGHRQRQADKEQGRKKMADHFAAPFLGCCGSRRPVTGRFSDLNTARAAWPMSSSVSFSSRT